MMNLELLRLKRFLTLNRMEIGIAFTMQKARRLAASLAAVLAKWLDGEARSSLERTRASIASLM